MIWIITDTIFKYFILIATGLNVPDSIEYISRFVHTYVNNREKLHLCDCNLSK